MALYISKGKAGLALFGAALITLACWPFRCRHRHLGWPRKERRHENPSDHYITCLDCGKQFGYDWKNMHVIKEIGMINRRLTRLQNAHSIGGSRNRVVSLGLDAQDPSKK